MGNLKSMQFRVALILIVAMFQTACATYHKAWSVHPDDMPRFQTDREQCYRSTYGLKDQERWAEACLVRIGYNLKVSQD